VRVDTAAYDECVITPHYDSLIAKLISYAGNRNDTIRRMKRALEMTVVEGVKTTIPLHQRILNDQDFIEGRITTRFLDRYAHRDKA
jgi:acetyl-CoA carboxylase biotin carboxylase subunit